MIVNFQLDGVEFTALNSGTQFKFTEAISLSVMCKSAEEVDRLWEKLTDGGEGSMCGWLKEQIRPLLADRPLTVGQAHEQPDPVKSQNVMKAMLQMRKLDSAALQAAYDQS